MYVYIYVCMYVCMYVRKKCKYVWVLACACVVVYLPSDGVDHVAHPALQRNILEKSSR